MGHSEARTAPAAAGGHVTEAYKYEMIVYWSGEDGAFLVEVPELPGCMADGPTPAAAVSNAQEVIAMWLDVAREEGRPIPEPRGRGVSTT